MLPWDGLRSHVCASQIFIGGILNFAGSAKNVQFVTNTHVETEGIRKHAKRNLRHSG